MLAKKASEDIRKFGVNGVDETVFNSELGVDEMSEELERLTREQEDEVSVEEALKELE